MGKYTQGRPVCVCDTECYVDYWSIGFRSVTDPTRQKIIEYYDGCPLDTKAIAKVFRNWQVVGFNFKAYDIPMIVYAMSGATNGELKRASDELIQYGVPWWVFLERMGLRIPAFFDHVDLMQVSPGAPTMPSLKIYAGRLHSRKMQELPIEIDEHIVPDNLEIIRPYHGNDLEVTSDMHRELASQLALRALMSDEYGVDLRSKSDAQIAEAVMKAEVERATGQKVYAPKIKPGSFKYQVPAFVQFQTPQMQEVLEAIREMRFAVDRAGIVHMPDELKALKIPIGSSVYKMGMGGLHSTESSVSHFSDDDYVLADRDATSFYPFIIIMLGLYPEHIGPVFLKVLKRILDRRVAAKKAGLKDIAETLKIVVNGAFGKFGSPFSAVASPNLMIQTTITGQLSVLMMIEAVELAGFQVVSANTDGFVTKVERARRTEFNTIILDWEMDTGFNTEETEYLSLHSRDVNSYIAIANEKGKKKVKVKGAFNTSGPGQPGAAGLKKNPDMDICTDAVIEFLKNGTPLEDTIEWCFDPRKFVTVRRVTGGAERDGERIGKALRWYYSREVHDPLKYISNGNNVPMSMGAQLMMELVTEMPTDVDYDYYVRESYAILQDIGMGETDPALRGRTGQAYGRLSDQKTVHMIDLASGVALCGKRRDSIRDAWIEYGKKPEGERICSKCRKVMK